jgi:amino acid transporter
MGEDMNQTTEQLQGGPLTEQQLHRHLGTAGNLMLTLSAMGPAMTVFIYVPVVYWVAGTWSFLATLIGAGIALGMALVYAEVGTAFPIAGGEYSMISRVLGRGTGFIVFAIQLSFYVLMLATFAVGAGIQLQTVWASVDPRMVGLVVFAVAALLSIPDIKIGKGVTGVLLVLQLVAIVVVSVLGLAHAHSPASRLFDLQAFAPDGAAMAITWSVILVGLTLGFFNLTGFNLVIVFSEETREPKKRIPRALLLAVGMVVLLIAIPTAAGLLGAPSLETLLTSPAPMSYVLESYGASAFNTFVNLAVFVAIVNMQLANVMAFGRFLYSGARDKAFPASINRVLSKLHPRFGTPWVASIVMAVIGAAAMFSSAITGLVTLTGFITLVFMGLMCIASIRIRSLRGAPDHYRMPAWPVVPLAVIAVFVVLATGQSSKDLLITAAIAGVAVIYYVGYLWPRRDTRWLLWVPDQDRPRVVGSESGMSPGTSTAG